MSNQKSQLFSKKGCCAGFTAEGREVVGHYRARQRVWTVWAGVAALTNPTLRSFSSASDADSYAKTLIDPQRTDELRWW